MMTVEPPVVQPSDGQMALIVGVAAMGRQMRRGDDRTKRSSNAQRRRRGDEEGTEWRDRTRREKEREWEVKKIDITLVSLLMVAPGLV